jgi:hypothetical protein
MISRRSSGSNRAESDVDPISSENITVTCRRSAAFVGCLSSGGYRGWRAYFSAEGSNRVEQLTAMSYKLDPEVLQVLRRQARQDRLIDLVIAEVRLILFEAEPPQPTSDVHHGAPVHLAPIMIPRGRQTVQGTPSNGLFGSNGDPTRVAASGAKRPLSNRARLQMLGAFERQPAAR